MTVHIEPSSRSIQIFPPFLAKVARDRKNREPSGKVVIQEIQYLRTSNSRWSGTETIHQSRIGSTRMTLVFTGKTVEVERGR